MVFVIGITLIELAQMEPPYNNMNPSRVLMKIRKADPPTLDAPHRWYCYSFLDSFCLLLVSI